VSGMTPADRVLASAMWHAARGWPVGPVKFGGKRPVGLRNGVKEFTTDRRTILNWFDGRLGLCNLAVATGYPGPDVLDVDVRPDGNGWAAFNRLKSAGLLAGAFRMIRTPSGGGLHVWFAGTGQQCGRLPGLHIDFKAAGGLVLVPPSYAGGWYEVLEERPPTGAVLDWEAAKRLLCPPQPYTPRRDGGRRGPGSARHLVAWLEGETEGNRNSGLYWAARKAAQAGDEEALGGLAGVALAAGLGEDEVRRTVASARKAASDG
jgi:hypothetical protein